MFDRTHHAAATLRPALCILAAVIAATSIANAQNPASPSTSTRPPNRRAINPRIYGVAYATHAQLNDLNGPLNRYGGNNTTRYNWQLNADNRGQRLVLPEHRRTSSATPGERRRYVRLDSASRRRAADDHDPDASAGSRSSARTAASWRASRSRSTARRPAATGSGFPTPATASAHQRPVVTGNDPNDANVPTNSHVPAGLGAAPRQPVGHGDAAAACATTSSTTSRASGTRRTATCIPTGATHGRDSATMLDYAAEIKAADPDALIVGPEEWGWSGYFFSGYDQQYGSQHGWSFLPDRANHGGADYLPWLLESAAPGRQRDRPALLDVFTVHYYPQGGEFSNDTSPDDAAAAQPLDALALGSELRRRDVDQRRGAADPAAAGVGSTRITIRARRSASPSTTGAPKATSTARRRRPTSSASSGAKASTWRARWTTPASSTPTYKAMKMYRNYDGNKSTFGDTSVAATVPNPDNVSSSPRSARPTARSP